MEPHDCQCGIIGDLLPLDTYSPMTVVVPTACTKPDADFRVYLK